MKGRERKCSESKLARTNIIERGDREKRKERNETMEEDGSEVNCIFSSPFQLVRGDGRR